MTEPASPASSPAPVSAGAFITTFSIAIVLIVLFLVVDTALAGIDRRENQRHAASQYDEGRALLARGDAAAARERFAAAVAAERGNTTYELGLAQAMIAEGRLADAEQALDALLDRTENSGPVNLIMARLLAQTGRASDAAVYFHRSIFGRWGADSTSRRTEARFELIDLLAMQRDEQAMLGELLPLEAAFPDSAALQRRLAHLFIRAGAPRRGVSILRDMLRTNPRDGDAYAGLGEAALALGNFVTARADLAEAARLAPNDSGIAGRLAVADTILALDPDVRGLGIAERAARAQALLQRTLSDVTRCNGPAAASALADTARAALASGAQPGSIAAPEQFIRYAVVLGPPTVSRCANGARPSEAMMLLLRSLDR